MQTEKKALNTYEDMPLGKLFNHHWGRTLRSCDNIIFCSETGQYNPIYFNAEYARSLGYDDTPVHPLFVFNVVGGMTVEDLSEGGGLFLGIDNLNNIKPVYPGDTLTSSSEIVERRLSNSRPEWGIITWRTRGVNQRDELVIEFDKTNMVRCRDAETEN